MHAIYSFLWTRQPLYHSVPSADKIIEKNLYAPSNCNWMQLHISSAIRSVVRQPIKSPFQSSTRERRSESIIKSRNSEPHLVVDDDDDLHTPAERLFNNIINSFLLDFEWNPLPTCRFIALEMESLMIIFTGKSMAQTTKEMLNDPTLSDSYLNSRKISLPQVVSLLKISKR